VRLEFLEFSAGQHVLRHRQIVTGEWLRNHRAVSSGQRDKRAALGAAA
jgi:hypothetical protein